MNKKSNEKDTNKTQKAKVVYRQDDLDSIIYDNVDKRKYPKLHKAQKSIQDKDSNKSNDNK
jgi:hypothetical protein